jgi:hypothetical protein
LSQEIGGEQENNHAFDVFGRWIYMTESLILAQNERWRRVLSMQVEG